MHMVSDELVDNNLRDMYRTNNIVQSIKLFSRVFNRLRTSVVLTLKHVFKSPEEKSKF